MAFFVASAVRDCSAYRFQRVTFRLYLELEFHEWSIRQPNCFRPARTSFRLSRNERRATIAGHGKRWHIPFQARLFLLVNRSEIIFLQRNTLWTNCKSEDATLLLSLSEIQHCLFFSSAKRQRFTNGDSAHFFLTAVTVRRIVY